MVYDAAGTGGLVEVDNVSNVRRMALGEDERLRPCLRVPTTHRNPRPTDRPKGQHG
jgi:hypothetical protein